MYFTNRLFTNNKQLIWPAYNYQTYSLTKEDWQSFDPQETHKQMQFNLAAATDWLRELHLWLSLDPNKWIVKLPSDRNRCAQVSRRSRELEIVGLTLSILRCKLFFTDGYCSVGVFMSLKPKFFIMRLPIYRDIFQTVQHK